MRSLGRRIAMGVTISALIVAAIPPAMAQPAEEDRSDNRFVFTYEAESGEMPTQTSSRRTTRSGVVDFEVLLRETNDTGSGLVGSLQLKLRSDHRVVYDGWFTLQVTTDEDEVAYQRWRPETVVLRPNPGEREAKLNFRFDLPSGEYRAIGLFKRS